jgi:hypothetical protein
MYFNYKNLDLNITLLSPKKKKHIINLYYLIGKPLLQKNKTTDIFIDPVLIGDCLIKKK